MANTVSVEQAATDALVAWITSQITDAKIWNEWPDAGPPLPVSGAISVLKAGPLDAIPCRPMEILKRVDDAPPAVTSTFTWRTHACTQPMQLDVWAVSKFRRDDLVHRLGEALTASKKVTLAAFLAAEGISTNQDPVVQAIVLQLAAPWDHLLASYQFDAPAIDDDAASSKRREFRATYRGQAFFDRTVSRSSPRIVRAMLPLNAGPAPASPAAPGETVTLTVTPTGSTVTRS
jgi:hypothetical protein